VSVTIATRKLLGSELGPQEIVHQIATAINQMDWDAKEMGVKVNWSTLWMNIGDEYEDEYPDTITQWVVRRNNFLNARVRGERTGE